MHANPIGRTQTTGHALQWHGWRSLHEWLADSRRVLMLERDAVASTAACSGRIAGDCSLCGSARGFDDAANLREGLVCAECGCNARQRAAAMVLIDAFADRHDATVYMTEHASPLFVALRRRLSGLRGSEFGLSLPRRLRLSTWLWRQGVPAWVRQQDVTALAMRAGARDGILCLDVLEHVPDADAALRQFARVCRPGGVLVLTVPFYDGAGHSDVVARTRADGSIEHLGAAEFHGDPVRGGVPCFHHFGWDLLDRLRAAGFADARAIRVADPARGLPEGQGVILAIR